MPAFGFYASVRAMNLYWHITPLCARKRPPIANANQLAAEADMTLPTAYRCFDGETALKRIDMETVRTLAKFFGVPWWKLFRVGK